MKGVMIMQYHLLRKWVFIGALMMIGATIMTSASDKKIIESVKAMERELGLKITDPHELSQRVRRTQQIPVEYDFFMPVVSPDGTTIAWSSYPHLYNGEGETFPFLKMESVKEGVQLIQVPGRVVRSFAVSSGAQVIVAIACPLNSPPTRPRELIAIDRRSGVVHDLTPFVTKFELLPDAMSENYVNHISVSGTGSLVALGTYHQIQVLEIPSGKTVYAGPGFLPQLSPDGKRLAFVHEGAIRIYSFADGSTVELLKGKRVKGIGGWSPDGRFLLAGAWTKLLALDKRQIIVDTKTGEYAVIGTLGDGDSGHLYTWVGVKLLY